MTTYARVCHNGHILGTSPNPEYISGDNFCPDCGTEGIIECKSCQDQKIHASEDNVRQEEVSRSDLDLFCRNCGEGYPWAGEEGSMIRGGKFVDGDYADDPFYQDTIDEINRCYKIGANGATMVLYRKLLENAIIDFLRAHYGVEDIDEYYDTNNRRHHRFSVLLDNLYESRDDLRVYSESLTHDFIQNVRSFKYEGDSQAHSIKIAVSDESIEDDENMAAYIANVLLEARKEARICNA